MPWWFDAIMAGFAVGALGRAISRRRPECRQYSEGFCSAWAWAHCTGGRCKAHCDLWCKCAPAGDPRVPLRVVDGGRKDKA